MFSFFFFCVGFFLGWVVRNTKAGDWLANQFSKK